MPSISTGVFSGGGGGSGNLVHLQPGAGGEPVGLAGLHAVEFDAAVFGDGRHRAARQSQQPRQTGVDAHARQSLGDGHRTVSQHAPLLLIVAPCIVAGATQLRSASRRTPVSRSALRRPTVSKSKPKIDSTTSKMAPPTTDGSATLKTGHQPTDKKSTTCPRSGPGARKNRSTRLPVAPPRIIPQSHRPPRRHQPPSHPEDADHHTGRDQRQHPGVSRRHRERGPRVTHQRPGHRVTDDRHRLARGQQLDGEHLGHDVKREHHARHRQQQTQPSRLPRRGNASRTSPDVRLPRRRRGAQPVVGSSGTSPSSPSARLGWVRPRRGAG